MNGNNRRKQILRILSDSSDPVSGANLAKQLGVSRQVIVQDIALLRANGSDILATNAGYVLQQIQSFSRVVKVIHSDEATEKELQIIIDLGGYVEDVFVYH